MAAITRRIGPSYAGDPLIPIMNLVCMLIPLLLYGAVFLRYNTLTVRAPSAVPEIRAQEPPRKELGLTVFATEMGFHIRVNPGFEMSWMAQATGATSGPDIPKLDGKWNYRELARRLAQIKADHGTETRIALCAEDDIPIEVIIGMMDHSRALGGEPLFPDVSLSRQAV